MGAIGGLLVGGFFIGLALGIGTIASGLEQRGSPAAPPDAAANALGESVMFAFACAMSLAGAVAGGVRFLRPTRRGFYVGHALGGAAGMNLLALLDPSPSAAQGALHVILALAGAVLGTAAGYSLERATSTA